MRLVKNSGCWAFICNKPYVILLLLAYLIALVHGTRNIVSTLANAVRSSKAEIDKRES
jgi:hypothetical protein